MNKFNLPNPQINQSTNVKLGTVTVSNKLPTENLMQVNKSLSSLESAIKKGVFRADEASSK